MTTTAPITSPTQPASNSAAPASTTDPADTGPDPVTAAQRRTTEVEEQIRVAPGQFRILTGDRPTGPLHVGHYFGTLAGRVRLQRAGVPVFVLIADYQVLTDRDVADNLAGHVDGLIADYLAAGLDPAVSTIFAHSAVSALNQLMLPFLSLVSVAELGRNPTVKAEIAAAGQPAVSGLMLTYPVHQAADILFCRANLVPVGQDQLPHLELTRAIARRFNDRYAGGSAFFPVPDALLSAAPNLLGTDGRKMSKSRGNTINLSDSPDETARLLRRARTDAVREISYDPAGRPEVSSLLLLAALCQGRAPAEIAAEIGSRGAAELKRAAIESVNEFLRPHRARRAELIADRGYLRSVLRAGNAVAAEVADQTLGEVRALMGTAY